MMRKLALGAVLVMALVGASVGRADAGQWTEPTTWASSTTLAVGRTNRGNIVSLWQLFVSSRYRQNRGDPYSPGVTGTFGTASKNYTMFWQAEHGLNADGIVGPDTWNAARFWHVNPAVSETAGWKYFQYRDTGYPGVVNIPYSKPFATWFFERCGGEYDRYDVTWPALDFPVNPYCD